MSRADPNYAGVFVQPPGKTAPGPAASLPWFNVKDYGAKGDGATDDTAAITAAFAAGTQVFFPPGTYRVTSFLTVPANVRVIAGIPTLSIIKYGNVDPPGGTNTLIMSVAVPDVVIDGIVFDGNSAVLTGFVSTVVVFNAQRVHFTRCTFQNTRGIGLLLSTNIVDCSVRYCRFTNVGFVNGVAGPNRFEAIAFTPNVAGDSFRNLVHGNVFNNIGLDSISVAGQWDTVVSDNRSNVSGGAGVYASNPKRLTITGNVLRTGAGVGAPGAAAIDLFSAEACTITGNVAYECSTDGIVITGTNVTITGNLCINNNLDGGAAKRAGIYVLGSGHTVVGNLCTDNQGVKTQQYGVITDTAATGLKVANNLVAGNGTAGYAQVNFSVDQSFAVNVDNTLVAAATLTLSPWHDTVFVSGNTGITSITAAESGRRVTLVFSGTPTVTDGGNLRLAGDFVATADDSISLVCDGVNWYETSRSVN